MSLLRADNSVGGDGFVFRCRQRASSRFEMRVRGLIYNRGSVVSGLSVGASLLATLQATSSCLNQRLGVKALYLRPNHLVTHDIDPN